MNIPYADIETVTLDVGNTLVAPDFDWVADELRQRGVDCDAEGVRRAEAAARPGFRPERGGDGEGHRQHVFRVYLTGVLQRLEGRGVALSQTAAALARELTPVLDGPENRQRLWSRVMPGVPEALRGLRELGLWLVAVSNSDGTAERILARLGLRGYLDGVLDSQLVGSEKPDAFIFRQALQRTASSPARTLHVGDQYEADVVGARRLGIHTILLDPYDDWGDVDCTTAPDLSAVHLRLAAART